jgi:hypothetical protein
MWEATMWEPTVPGMVPSLFLRRIGLCPIIRAFGALFSSSVAFFLLSFRILVSSYLVFFASLFRDSKNGEYL